jgi:hypothetical protein
MNEYGIRNYLSADADSIPIPGLIPEMIGIIKQSNDVRKLEFDLGIINVQGMIGVAYHTNLASKFYKCKLLRVFP